MKGIPTVDSNSHRGFCAGMRNFFEDCHKNFEIPFSVLFNTDQEELLASTKGDKLAKQYDIVKYKKYLTIQRIRGNNLNFSVK